MSKITIDNGVLNVPKRVTIPFIEGDGVGAEVWAATRGIVDAAVKRCYADSRSIEWMEVLAGQKAFDSCGEWLPAETMAAFKEYLVGIKGPLTTPVGEGIRSLNVALRQELDLYVCMRPVRWFSGVASPVKEPQKVDMVIFRENTEDIYAGIEWKAGSPEAEKFYKFISEQMGVAKVRFPVSSSFGVKPVSKEGSERLIRSAINYAIEFGRPSVTLVHKGNIMKFTEGGFKNWGYEMAEREFSDRVYTMAEYARVKSEDGAAAADAQLEAAKVAGKIIIKDVICDAFLQNTLLRPEDYDVIATLNLNGDYVSDQLAAMVGGIGIAPGGNINYMSGHAIFEATHGTAPDIAGKDIVNPCSMLLSAAMMMEYIGWREVSDVIVNALERSFSECRATGDLARFMEGGVSLSTSEFMNEIINSRTLKRG